MSLVEEISSSQRPSVKRSYGEVTVDVSSSAQGDANGSGTGRKSRSNNKKKINYNFAALEAAAHGINQDEEEEVLTREERKTLKRLQELNKENYNAVSQRIEVPKEFMHLAKPAQTTATVKRILVSKKQLVNYLDENESLATKKHWLTLEVPTNTSTTVTVKKLVICSICGNNAKYSCVRCKTRFCSVRCGNLHNETRCSTFTG